MEDTPEGEAKREADKLAPSETSVAYVVGQFGFGAANLGRSRLLGGQGRLKAGCGQNCPPHPIGCHSIVRASLVSESRAPA